MRPRAIVGTTLLLLGLFGPNAPAAADPITITGGTVFQPGGAGPNPGSGSIFGTENFRWAGQIDPLASFGTQCEIRCSPGESVNLSGMLSGTNVKGEVTYQNQQFLVGGSSNTFGALNLDFTAGSIVLPSVGTTASFTSTFTASGQLLFPFFGPPAQPAVPLSGSGIVTALFIPSQFTATPGWQLSGLTYEFSDAAVPEPATMLLVGGGLALLRRYRRPSDAELR
jgi:hypothetical protein